MTSSELIITMFKLLIDRDKILSERLAQLESENAFEIETESTTHGQLQALMAQIQQTQTAEATQS